MATNTQIDDGGRAQISAAVEAAESGTSGEIVTIIADQSDRYADVALWWSALVALIALCAYALAPDFYLGIVEWIGGGWGEPDKSEILEIALALVGLKFVAMRLILQWMPLRLWLTPKRVKADRVRGRAVRYFKVGAEKRTHGRTGILIYLSSAEHMAEIVADEAIHSKIEDSAWGEAMAKLVRAARDNRLADGMVAAIGDIGAILAAHFPRAEDDVNELPDRLIEL